MSALIDYLIDQEVHLRLLEHVELTAIAMGLAIGVAVPAGLLLTRSKRVAPWVIGAVGAIQTLPSLALVALMVPLLGVGGPSLITALFLYALLPIVRNTYTGVMSVDSAMIEAARGMGMTSGQILYRIELPLSVPVIMAGIRTSTVICVGIATLGGIIAAGGLGDLIWLGLSRVNNTLIVAGAVPAMLLALALDGALALMERAFTPRGLVVKQGSSE
jgi:osmoprotectant transport system permease protein